MTMNTEILNLIPKSRMRAWHAADDITGVVNGGNISNVPDRSGNGRPLSAPSSDGRPTYVASGLNGRPAINFPGTGNPLIYDGTVGNVKHIFVVAAYADAAFGAEFAGLLTGYSDSAADVLVGVNTTTRFNDFSYSNYTYKLRGVSYAAATQAAPMNGSVAVIEAKKTDGWAFAGITLGNQYSYTVRRWKGRVYEVMLFADVLADWELRDVYEYFAIKYFLWSQATSGGPYIFPFQPNWSRPLGLDKTILQSRSVAGSTVSREKQAAKRAFEPRFENRSPEEYEAAAAFWDEHYPEQEFIYRDGASVPPRDATCLFTAGLPSTADSYRSVNYSFQAVES